MKQPMYFVGVRDKAASIFRCLLIPTWKDHPPDVLFCFGPYDTRTEAEEVAMYRNYCIDSNRRTATPLWPRDW